MGTNYYHEPANCRCPTCGQMKPEFNNNRLSEGRGLHIGKSSAGWKFGLRVHADQGLLTLEDWQKRWAAGGKIVDEYGEEVSVAEMLHCITKRSHPKGLTSMAEWVVENPKHASLVDLRPVPEGSTYELCNYEFS